MTTAVSLEKLLASCEPGVLSTGRHVLNARQAQAQRSLFFSHLAAFDQLNGGLKRGSLVEVTGRGSSGKFSLELALLAAATRAGDNAALIDWGDHFDPRSAQSAGVHLARLFWVRPRRFADALKSTEIVLAAGFRLVLLDLGIKPITRPQTSEAVWLRFARDAKTHDSLVLVFSPTPIGSAAADLCIEASNAGSAWTRAESPWRLLEGLSVHWQVTRQRGTSDRPQNRLSLPVRDAR